MAKSPTTKDYAAVSPYLRIKGATEAIAFYVKAFGAKEHYRLQMGDRIGHAEIDVGGTIIMLSDEFPDHGVLGPATLKGTTVTLILAVANADVTFKKAVAAGGKVRRPLTDEFYGHRSGQIEDPFGHVWMIQQKLEEVSPKEMQKRLDALMADGQMLAEKRAPRKLAPKPKKKK